jgi:hypothetical protein
MAAAVANELLACGSSNREACSSHDGAAEGLDISRNYEQVGTTIASLTGSFLISSNITSDAFLAV